MLLGVITGIITTSKSLQGFEPNKKKEEEKISQESISSIEEFDVDGK